MYFTNVACINNEADISCFLLVKSFDCNWTM